MPLALGLWALQAVVPIAVAVVVALIVIPGRVLAALVGTTVGLLLKALGTRLASRRHWASPVTDRLASFENPDVTTYVLVSLPAPQLVAAQAALRRAHFVADAHNRGGDAPLNAPDLDHRLHVYEAAAWKQAGSDDDRMEQIRQVLAAADVRARVGGIDVVAAQTPEGVGVRPGSGPEPARP